MKKFGFIILGLAMAIYLSGCGKKQPSLEEMQEPLSMEALSTLDTEAKVAPETKAQGVQVTPSAPANLEALPPVGPYKPTAMEIQTALKNAGYYSAVADGKIGPMTKKAIEEFQKANGLQADAKVGPKTWAVLSSYLNPSQTTPKAAGSKKKR